MKKSKIAVFLLTASLVVFGYGYYKANHNIPLKYTIEYYQSGDYVDCEGLQIKILSTENRKSDDINKYGTEYIELVVTSEIENTTAEVKNAIEFQESQIVIGYYGVYSGPATVEKSDLRNIQPGEKLQAIQEFRVEKERYENGKDKMYMYFREGLYPNEIKEKFSEGIRYRKALKI